jgi:RNA polymerase sigma-70 factor (ECF subfamily)
VADASTSELQELIERTNAGDDAARAKLIEHACGRLRALTRRMLQDFRRVHRWEETDDVLQNALVRLLQALRAAPPASVAEFFRLAARQIRRELLDLARHYYGPEGQGARHETSAPAPSSATSPPAQDPSDSSNEPARLAAWSEFHRHVESLPDDEREAFDLVWYQGLTQAEAAAVLGVAEVTVRRRWLKARLLLQEKMKGEGPAV